MSPSDSSRRASPVCCIDLLTAEEGEYRRNVFDIPLLGARVVEAIAWAGVESDVARLSIGLFGASTGAAAALTAAADEPSVAAVVSRGGRPDLAGDALRRVKAPTLLIVGGLDYGVIELNRSAEQLLGCRNRLDIVPGATHLFEEPGHVGERRRARDRQVVCRVSWRGLRLGEPMASFTQFDDDRRFQRHDDDGETEPPLKRLFDRLDFAPQPKRLELEIVHERWEAARDGAVARRKKRDQLFAAGSRRSRDLLRSSI